MAIDPDQRFISLVPGGSGVIFAIQADGALFWYQNTGWSSGTASWAAGSGAQIGTGWHEFTTVLAAGDGQLFGLKADGTLLWYKVTVNAGTGSASWAAKSGTQIGSGFDKYKRIIGGWSGVFYALDATGTMYLYYYAAGNGSAVWANGLGTRIGAGFNPLGRVFADPGGVIYGVQQSAALTWWCFRATNLSTGKGTWANGGNGIGIGDGWGETSQRTVFSNGSGVFYAVRLDTSATPGTDNILTWYRLNNSQTVDSSGVSWVNQGAAKSVGQGFTIEPTAALQGYVSSLSVSQGGSVGVQVSTTWPTYTGQTVRLAPSASGQPVAVTSTSTYKGALQLLRTGYRSNGCAWTTSFTVATAASWTSGVYAAKLISPQGNEFDVMFVVRPANPSAGIAVVLPTNTYNAYNAWAGHNQYTDGQDGEQRVVTMQRPNIQTAIGPTGAINHTLYSDLLLLNWMTSAGVTYDVYSDLDVDGSGAAWMPQYKAIVLGSHPEYWTQTARENLISYQSIGGRVISTGGNCIYEEMSYTANRSAIIFRNTAGDRNLFQNLGEFESDILGTSYNPASYLDFYPYEVVTDHSFLNGTGLSVGATFGSTGYNVAASGWEVDWAASGISDLVVIAQGLNPNGGASMCYLPTSAGGWVFTTGSISFNGSIASDPAIQQILRNVFAAAVE
jgi:hypothetical protein